MLPVSIYAAYGTNLDPAQMARRAPRSPLLTTGWLEGWRLTFGEGLPADSGALATLAEDPGQRVFVALYDLMEWDEPHLDSWEGADRRDGFGPGAGAACAYRKVTVRARTADMGTVTAWAYVLDAYEGGLPSAIQLGQLAAAAEKAGAPGSYVSDLLARECLPTEL
ncbi:MULTISPECIES: gamma-glutamylcyclotransferase family protein [Nocardiopsidaceae]|uniref:gamma-glutamylcyclotransferase family protein n=1 Tax=Streptomonospora nanhaiensis TaxID=1323731 RepID=UPI003D36F903